MKINITPPRYPKMGYIVATSSEKPKLAKGILMRQNKNEINFLSFSLVIFSMKLYPLAIAVVNIASHNTRLNIFTYLLLSYSQILSIGIAKSYICV